MQTPFSILSVLTVGENALNISYLSLEHQKMYWGNACAEYWVTENGFLKKKNNNLDGSLPMMNEPLTVVKNKKENPRYN